MDSADRPSRGELLQGAIGILGDLERQATIHGVLPARSRRGRLTRRGPLGCPAAIGAFFTEDGIFVTDRGPIYGRQAIEKWYAELFKGWQPKNHLGTFDPDSPHLIGTAGDALWETGGWSETGQGPNGEPIPVKGYWSAVKVRQGEGWKIRMMTANVTPAPAAAASPTVTPSSQ